MKFNQATVKAKLIKIFKFKYFFIILLTSFFLGAHWQKDSIFPFGQGYYATFKDIRKYGFNFKEELQKIQLAKQAEEQKAKQAEEQKAKQAEEQKKRLKQAEEQKKRLDIKTLLYSISDRNYNFDYDHIDVLNESVSKVELIGIKGNKGWYASEDIPLNLFLISVDLKLNKVSEKLIFSVAKNRRATDVYVTKSKRILFSNVMVEENGNAFLTLNELTKKNKQYASKLIFKSVPIVRKFIVFQAGGKVSEKNEDNILLTVGDFHKGNLLNDTDNQFGKIIHINLNTKDNYIWSVGHRNPQGLTYSHTLEEFIATEHGPQGGDEINLILRDHNYGWPQATYGRPYNVSPGGLYANFGGASFGMHEKYTKPIYSFLPSIGIMSIEQLPSNQNEFPNWKDNFLICSSLGVYRAEIDYKDSPRLIFYEKLTSGGCRDIAILKSGKFFVTGFSDRTPKDYTFRVIQNRD
jgi:hypothetical protein